MFIFFRVLDIDNDENYVLSLDSNTGFQHGESINCLAYSPQKGKLVVSTLSGGIISRLLFGYDDIIHCCTSLAELDPISFRLFDFYLILVQLFLQMFFAPLSS